MIARSSSTGCQRGEGEGGLPHARPDHRIGEGPVVEVGADGDDHPHARRGGERRQHLGPRVGVGERPQLLELVEHDDELAVRRHGGGERLLEGAAWVVADRDLAQRLEQSGDGIGARHDHDDE